MVPLPFYLIRLLSSPDWQREPELIGWASSGRPDGFTPLMRYFASLGDKRTAAFHFLVSLVILLVAVPLVYTFFSGFLLYEMRAMDAPLSYQPLSGVVGVGMIWEVSRLILALSRPSIVRRACVMLAALGDARALDHLMNALPLTDDGLEETIAMERQLQRLLADQQKSNRHRTPLVASVRRFVQVAWLKQPTTATLSETRADTLIAMLRYLSHVGGAKNRQIVRQVATRLSTATLPSFVQESASQLYQQTSGTAPDVEQKVAVNRRT